MFTWRYLAAAPVDPEAHLDAARVERYARTLDDLPPVLVFETSQGPLLVDGYHRVAAARRLELETIEAEVRRGTRREALRHAARLGAAERGISVEEAAAYIERRGRPLP
jgi:ParB-like chromosome segregation protein Spo0J